MDTAFKVRSTLGRTTLKAVAIIDSARGDWRASQILDEISSSYGVFMNTFHGHIEDGAAKCWSPPPASVRKLCEALPHEAVNELTELGLLPYTRTITHKSNNGTHIDHLGTDVVLHTAVLCVISSPKGASTFNERNLLLRREEIFIEGGAWSARADTPHNIHERLPPVPEEKQQSILDAERGSIRPRGEFDQSVR